MMSKVNLVSQYEEDPPQNKIKDNDINSLYRCRKKFRHFLANLQTNFPGEYPFTLSHQVSTYSAQILQKKVRAQDVLNMISKRIQKVLKNGRLKKNWGKEDITILAWLLQYLIGEQAINNPQIIETKIWEHIATFIPGATSQQCMFKWLGMKHLQVKKHKWSSQESQLLRMLVEDADQKNINRNWKEISRQLYIHNSGKEKIFRSAKQCQQQWKCFLKPDIKKGLWTSEQDIGLLSHIKISGKKRWCEAVDSIPGRTENALKNRYSLIIEKYKKTEPQLSEEEIVVIHLRKLRKKIRNKIHLNPTRQIEQDHNIVSFEQFLQKRNEQKNIIILNIDIASDQQVAILNEDEILQMWPKQSNIQDIDIQDEKSAIDTIDNIYKDKDILQTPSDIKLIQCHVSQFMKLLQIHHKTLIPAKLNLDMEHLSLTKKLSGHTVTQLQQHQYHK